MNLRRLVPEKIEDAMLGWDAPGDERDLGGSARQRCEKLALCPHSGRGPVPQEWHRTVLEKCVQNRERRAAKTNHNCTGSHLNSIDQCTPEEPSSGLKGWTWGLTPAVRVGGHQSGSGTQRALSVLAPPILLLESMLYRQRGHTAFLEARP